MGFFSQSELSKKAKVEIDTQILESECSKCNLYKDCRTKKLCLSGKGRKKILVLGDWPSETDDMNGIHFSGETGDYLKSLFKEKGISLRNDCWSLNAIKCPLPRGKKPANYAKACAPGIHKLIYENKPKAILVLGDAGLMSLVGDDFSDRSTKRWRDHFINDEKFKTTIYSTFHPRIVVQDKFNKNIKSVFERDINKFLKKSNILKFQEVPDYEENVTVLTTIKKVTDLLEYILRRKPLVYYDYESTGLKPFRSGHKIVSLGIAISSDKAYSFPIDFNSFWTASELKKIQLLWKKILLDKKIKMVAHNIKFEDIWSKIIFGVRPRSVIWDTMNASHIIDNRSSYSGLKFQTFLTFGVRPYDKFIAPFLKAKNGEFNTVEKAPFKELHTYCGLDCLYGYRLYEIQKTYLNGRKGLLNANSFFTKGLYTMGTLQLGGIPMNEDHYEIKKKQLIVKVNRLKRQLLKGREGTMFKERFGRPMSLTSNADLGLLFYDTLGYDPVYTGNVNAKTGALNYKTDAETLAKIDIPFIRKLSEMKKFEKAKGTYISQFQREIVNGFMYPFFDLTNPVTYRSSSSRPNFQNLPAREKAIMKIIRSGIIPSLDHYLCEADFGGAEVITSVCYHKDKNFYNYLVDPSTDMHRDNACDLWMLDAVELNNPNFTKEEAAMAKMIRFFAKNNWTFAEFYGDWYDSCGRNVWENCITKNNLILPSGISLLDHIHSKGINDINDFLEHCKIVEDKMWNQRFPQYTQWKKDIVNFYQKHGYIETYFGFRFQGYMDKKQCSNYPIQGTSFHLLVYTLIEIDKFIKRHKLRTRLIGQIHDSIIADVHKDEATFYLQGLKSIVDSLQDRFKWLIVPMEIEAELSKLYQDGGNFSDMYEVKNNMIDSGDLSKVFDRG